jgi:hypothetical protein
MKNKKGGDKIISVYWFAILFIVAAAVVYMVSSFYGAPYDVREAEADILIDKVADCISEGGYLKNNVLSEGFSGNFMGICSLNFETEDYRDWKTVGQYYVELEIFEFNTTSLVLSLQEGNSELKDFCELKGESLPVCLERSFYLVDNLGNGQTGTQSQYQINVLSVVRKTEKNTR